VKTPISLLWICALGLLGGCAAPPASAPSTALPPIVSARHEWRQADGRLNVAATINNPAPTPATVRVACAFGAGPGATPERIQIQNIQLAPGESGTVRFAAEDVTSSAAAISVTPAAAAR
jgi:hypothetical protein